MSIDFSLTMGQGGRYTVTERDGVTLVEGSIPVDHMVALSALEGKNAVMSHYLAQLANVQLAWGQPDRVDELAKKLKEGILKSRPLMTPLERWLAVGSRGRSSNAIVGNLKGIFMDSLKAHPGDPSDLLTCVKLLEEVPELREDFAKMAGVSAAWEALVRDWESLVGLLREEAGERWSDGRGWKSPRTFDAMQRTLAVERSVATG